MKLMALIAHPTFKAVFGQVFAELRAEWRSRIETEVASFWSATFQRTSEIEELRKELAVVRGIRRTGSSICRRS